MLCFVFMVLVNYIKKAYSLIQKSYTINSNSNLRQSIFCAGMFIWLFIINIRLYMSSKMVNKQSNSYVNSVYCQCF